MALCHIALGGNEGDVAASFARALERLSDAPGTTVRAVSRNYRTAGVGELAAGEFLNGGAALETELAPRALLDRMHEVESSLGRVRTERWGPRPIDLDLILYEDRRIDEPRLVVPHPAAWYRRFVLDPLAEIAANVVHPVKGLSIGALRARLLARPLRVALAGGTAALREDLRARIAGEFPGVTVGEWNARAAGAEPEPVLLFWLGEGDSSGEPGVSFAKLPIVPRIDAAAGARRRDAAELGAFIRDVLHSALGEPVPAA